MPAHYPKRRSGLKTRDVEDETVILDRAGGFIHQLNRTASFIWSRCDGQSTVEAIGQQLIEVFDVDPRTAADDVAIIVEQLQQLSLLEPC